MNEETITLQEYQEKINELKIEFDNQLKKELENAKKTQEQLVQSYEEQIKNIKIAAMEQVNNSIRTVQSSAYTKERKMITSVCKDLQFHLETFIQQLRSRFTTDAELPYMIGLLYENLHALFEDLNIQILNTQVGDAFKPEMHNICSIESTPENAQHLENTITKVIKQGFKYNNQIIVPSSVNIYKSS